MKSIVIDYSLNKKRPAYDVDLNDQNLVLSIKKNQEYIINLKNIRYFTLNCPSNVQSSIIIRLEESLELIDVKINVVKDSLIKLNLLSLGRKDKIDVNLEADVDENGHFDLIVSDFSSNDVKMNIKTNLNAYEANGYIRLATVASHDEEKKFTVNLVSKSPYSFGKMDNYGVVKDRGRLLIEGIGKIEKKAHGSSSLQNNKIIIFDEQAVATAKPYLLIDEYDVKASHACSVGRIDENQIYYLCSRGLKESQARRFITLGYLTPVLDYLDNQKIKEEIFNSLAKKVE